MYDVFLLGGVKKYLGERDLLFYVYLGVDVGVVSYYYDFLFYYFW